MSATDKNPETRIALFQRKDVRRTIHNNEWWFVVEDVVLALIDSRDAKQYIQRMKQRDPQLQEGWVQNVHTLPIPTEGGPQAMLCANTEGVFRLMQSIPSPRAEPFKRWLAKVGYERIQEIEDPEIAMPKVFRKIRMRPTPVARWPATPAANLRRRAGERSSLARTSSPSRNQRKGPNN